MGDRHGGCFARRGRALNPPHPHIDAHRGVGFRWRARAKEFAPREKALLGESLPTRRTSEKICPARERSPRRRLPDTAHERKDLPRAETLPTAKASRHGARAKEFAPRENAPHGEGLPTRRAVVGGICPAQERSLGEGLSTRRTSERICPTGVRVRPTGRRTAGRPRPTDSRKTPLRRGRTRDGAAAAEFIHTEKKTTP